MSLSSSFMMIFSSSVLSSVTLTPRCTKVFGNSLSSSICLLLTKDSVKIIPEEVKIHLLTYLSSCSWILPSTVTVESLLLCLCSNVTEESFPLMKKLLQTYLHEKQKSEMLNRETSNRHVAFLNDLVDWTTANWWNLLLCKATRQVLYICCIDRCSFVKFKDDTIIFLVTKPD